MKRAFDILITVILLIAFLPLTTAIALVVRLSSGSPVLHRATRIGLNDRPFTLLKFRTMVRDAATSGPPVTVNDDPRITRIGRVLRRTKVDELPQLWNVLRGDMSLVGPRPEDPRFVVLYSALDRAVLSVRPGITGASQLAFRHEEELLPADGAELAYVRDLMPQKLCIDLEYVRNQSLQGDAQILLRTLLPLFR